MRNIGQLRRVEIRLIKDLEESTLSFADLGKRYGVSRQAIFQFALKRGIKRSKREHTKDCLLCQSIMRIAKKPHSAFISSRTIKKQLSIGKSKWNYHIKVLRKEGIVSAKFGRLRSQKMEQAYQLYFKKRLPIGAIGRQVGLKNLKSAIKQHKAYGWDVPAPLLEYGDKDRRKAMAKMNRKTRRSR